MSQYGRGTQLGDLRMQVSSVAKPCVGLRPGYDAVCCAMLCCRCGTMLCQGSSGPVLALA
jgi:hypothetical protein